MPTGTGVGAATSEESVTTFGVREHGLVVPARAELRLEAAALATCKGIVLGLYRVRRQGGGACLEWAPDFPKEAAAQTLSALAGRESAKEFRAAERPRLDATFVDEQTPEWREFIARCQRRG